MNPFTDHPRAAGQTYAQHWRFAMGVAVEALGAAAAAAVHACLPFLFETTASRLLDDLHARIEHARRAGAPQPAP
jgi:hypothetical protein